MQEGGVRESAGAVPHAHRLPETVKSRFVNGVGVKRVAVAAVDHEVLGLTHRFDKLDSVLVKPQTFRSRRIDRQRQSEGNISSAEIGRDGKNQGIIVIVHL